MNYVQNIVPYGDFMDIPALFRSGISHKREILHKDICFVFRKWEPLPPFTKMPYDAICITRYCDIHSIVIPNAQSSAMCKGHSWMLKNKSTHKIFPFIDSMHLSFFFICLIVNNQFYVFFIFFIRIFNNTHSI